MADQLAAIWVANFVLMGCLLPTAAEGFDADGRLTDDVARASLESLCDKLLDTARSLTRHG